MLKQTLLAFSVLGFAATASAADITNPFFLPESLHLASITSAQFGKSALKDKTWGASVQQYYKAGTQELQFGILNNLAVVGSLAKDWEKIKDREHTFPTYKMHNDLDWTAGLAWNILDCNTKLQLSSVYGQDAPRDEPSEEYHKGTYKYFNTQLKLGYQFKTFLPYVTLNVHTPLAQTDIFRDNRWDYRGKVGLYQGKCNVWSLDTGLAWEFNRVTHSRYLDAVAEASLYVTKNVALGVYGSYLLDGEEKGDPKVHDKSVGARLRLYF